MAGRILVPLDGSALAEQALSCAITLARGLPAELVLLRAVWLPPDALGMLGEAAVEMPALLSQWEAEAEVYLSGLVQQLKTMGLDAYAAVLRSPPAEAIVDYAGQMDIDQIVMATHGYSGLQRWTHGSVAERVLQAAHVPLLLLRVAEPDPARDWRSPISCRRILLPLDGSPMAEQILPTATTLAQALSAQLILFQVPVSYAAGWMAGEWAFPLPGLLEAAEEEARGYLRAVAGRLEAQGVDVLTDTGTGSVAAAIVDYADANRVDLVAMCTHGRTGLARWALGSVADRVLRAGSTPLLLVRGR